jgi:hypothetical protein
LLEVVAAHDVSEHLNQGRAFFLRKSAEEVRVVVIGQRGEPRHERAPLVVSVICCARRSSGSANRRASFLPSSRSMTLDTAPLVMPSESMSAPAVDDSTE